MRNIGIVLVLVFMASLVASALNVSNESINELTGEERKAMIAVKIDDVNKNVILMGEEYQLAEPIEKSLQFSDYCYCLIRDYLLRIWTIFQALSFQGQFNNSFCR